jgi:hypothetical protein
MNEIIKIENLQNTEMDNPKQKEDDTKKIKSNTTKQVPALFLSKEKLENDNNKTTLNSNDTKLPNSKRPKLLSRYKKT